MCKILIAIPCMDQVPALFAQSLAMIRKGEHSCGIALQSGSLIYTSRNNLAVKAMEMEADYVFWLDSDMVFAPDTLLRMVDTLEKNNLDFLSGLYFRRVPPFSPVLYKKLGLLEDGSGAYWEEFEDIPQDGIFEVEGCGFGAVLIKPDVLFDVQAIYGTMFNPLDSMGEDIAFCYRAREMGYKIFCDPSTVLGHVGYSVINGKFFESYKNANQTKEAADV